MENYNYNNPYGAQMDDGALDWDSVVEETTFEPLKPGVYPFIVSTYTRGRHNASTNLPACPQATVTFIIKAGEQGERKIDHNFFLHKKTQGFLFDFFRAIGSTTADGKVKMDWTKIQGAQGMCEIYTEKYQRRDGGDGFADRIRRFIEPTAPQGFQSAPTAMPGAMPAAAPATPGAWTPGGF